MIRLMISPMQKASRPKACPTCSGQSASMTSAGTIGSCLCVANCIEAQDCFVTLGQHNHRLFHAQGQVHVQSGVCRQAPGLIMLCVEDVNLIFHLFPVVVETVKPVFVSCQGSLWLLWLTSHFLRRPLASGVAHRPGVAHKASGTHKEETSGRRRAWRATALPHRFRRGRRRLSLYRPCQCASVSTSQGS